MSRSEESVRPFLEKTILGRQTILSEEKKVQLAEYLTYKLMLVDWTDERPVLSLNDGKAFREHKQMPPGWQIILCNCFEGKWRHHSRTIATGIYPAEQEGKIPTGVLNTKSFAIGFGNLFVFATTSPAELYACVNPTLSKTLWPIVDGPTFWPPQFPITSDQAETIANLLWRIGESTNITVDGDETFAFG